MRRIPTSWDPGGAEPAPEAGERVESERQPRQHVADRGDEREPVTREAGRDQQTVETRHGTQQRKVVRRECFDAGPAPGDRARGERRIDGASDLETSAHAVVQHLPAVHRLVRNTRGPASADKVGAIDELLRLSGRPKQPTTGVRRAGAASVRSIWRPRPRSESLTPTFASKIALHAPAATSAVSHGRRVPSLRTTATTRAPSTTSASAPRPSSMHAPSRRAAVAHAWTVATASA